MGILVECKSCGKTLTAPDGSEGRRAKCPSCGTVLNIGAAKPPPETLDPVYDAEADEPELSAEADEPRGTGKKKKGKTIPCDYCGETISAAAEQCPHCGEILTEPANVDFGAIFSEGVRLFSENFMTLCSAMFVFLIVGQVASAALMHSFGLDDPQLFQRHFDMRDPTHFAYVFGSIYGAIIFITLCLGIGQGAVTFGVAAATLGHRPTLGWILRRTFASFWRILGAKLLVMLVVALGSMACVVPGIIFMFRYVAAVEATAIEQVGPLAGMRRSKELTQKSQLVIFLIALVGFVPLAMINGIMGMIPNFPLRLVVTSLIGTVGSAFCQTLFAVYYIACRTQEGSFFDDRFASQIGWEDDAP